MKLPKLPKMPSQRKKSAGAAPPRGPSKLAALPPMPRESKPSERERPEPTNDVEPAGPWEPTETGRWFITNSPTSYWGGRCAKCGGLKRAKDLEWYAEYRFGQVMWEGWACPECRKHNKGWQGSRNAPPIKRDTTSTTGIAPGPSDRERIYWAKVKMQPQVDAWEGEGGAVRDEHASDWDIQRKGKR